MALIERAFLDSRLFNRRARQEARASLQPTPEPPQPIYSEAFLQARAQQDALDARMAALVPTGPAEHIGFGQDRDVSLLPTTNGDMVRKTLRPDSRPHMVFGLGVPASAIPVDTDMTGTRDRLVAEYSKDVDPHVVAEKLRLVHVLATTYLGDEGKRTIWPTATVVQDGQVHDIQRFLPRFSPPNIERDLRERDLEVREKARLFEKLRDRWSGMIRTPDFKQMPPDVQDYWLHFPPDSGYGTNAVFLGLGNVVAIDY